MKISMGITIAFAVVGFGLIVFVLYQERVMDSHNAPQSNTHLRVDDELKSIAKLHEELDRLPPPRPMVDPEEKMRRRQMIGGLIALLGSFAVILYMFREKFFIPYIRC